MQHRAPFARVLLAAVATLAAGVGAAPRATAAELPPVKHVFVIVLENKNAAVTFSENSPAPYLAKTLPSLGQFVPNYYATGHLSLDNYIAMVSGQAPNPQTQADCQYFTDFVGAPVLDLNGQAVGQGCVYPAFVPTVADQLEAKGLTWRGYMEDMAQPCQHPPLNGKDPTQSASATSQYAARHNPFVYFHSIIDEPTCAANDVPLSQLTADLAEKSSTPNFAFITPDLCSDGHDTPCADGRPGGYESIDAFLEEWVPKITSAPAFEDSMLIVTFDEAEADTSPESDASACCGEIPGPNSPMPGIFGPGGGRTGAVILSPWTTPGSVNSTAYNHYALLRSIEDIFGLDHLGFAAAAGLTAFHDDVFNAPEASMSAFARSRVGAAASHGRPAAALDDETARGLAATGGWPWAPTAAALAALAVGGLALRRRRRRAAA